MDVSFQNKVDRNVFIEKNWNILLNAIKEDYNCYENKFRKSIRNTLIVSFFSLLIVLGIIWTQRDNLTSNTISIVFGSWLICWFLGFFLDMIDFPYYRKQAKKAKEESKKFFEVETTLVTTENLISLFKNGLVFSHNDYCMVKKLINDLYIFEKIQECKVINFTEDGKYIKKIKYADEDGVIENLDCYIETKKSINLSEDNYLIQMTENGLKFIKPIK